MTTRKPTKLLPTKARRKNLSPTSLELEYRLSELPSAQYRAGLAGLVLLVQWLAQRGNTNGICRITRLDSYGAGIQFDRKGLGLLLDGLFAATWQPRKNDESKRDAVPTGAFLAEWDTGGKEKLWLSLWQEAVLTILRNKERNRLPFVARAEGRETKEAEKSWSSLHANSMEALSGTFLLGARAKNADQVPFLTTARLKFLLYFWPLVIWLHRLASLNKDNELELSSYIIAIPDVSDLQLFCEVFPAVLRQRSNEKFGTRIPKASLINLPIEASFEALSKIKELLPLSSSSPLKQAVIGVEVFQVDRTKHDILIQDFRRVTTDPLLLEEYSQLQAATTNRLLRQQRMDNLINGVPAWFGFLSLICTQPLSKTIGSYTFRQDCRSWYAQYLKKDTAMSASKKKADTAPEAPQNKAPRQAPASLEEAVYEFVRTYLNRKVAIKEKLVWGEIQHDAKKKAAYNEKKRDLARTTSYSVRSHVGEDFVEFFTTTLCSVSQQMSEQGYLRIAHSLYEEPAKLRTLTLLALAAQA